MAMSASHYSNVGCCVTNSGSPSIDQSWFPLDLHVLYPVDQVIDSHLYHEPIYLGPTSFHATGDIEFTESSISVTWLTAETLREFAARRSLDSPYSCIPTF